MRPPRFRSAFAFALVLASGLAFARPQQSEADKVIALGRSDNRVMEHLDHLVNRIGPRLTSSDNFRNACAWTLAEFERFGLHNCHLEQWGEFPVGFNRGPSSGRMLAPEKKELTFGTNAWTAGTRGRVSGPAVLAPANEEELARVRPKLKGAWVVIAPPARPAGRRGPPGEAAGAAPGASESASGRAQGAANSGATESANGERPPRGPRGRPGAGPDRAFRDALEKAYAEEGIAGTIRSGRGDLILTSGSSKVAFDKLPTLPAINLLAAEHKEIVDHLKAGDEVRLEFDIRNWFEQGPIALSNVIAEIPGTDTDTCVG
jgi:carboxypeptidase Q